MTDSEHTETHSGKLMLPASRHSGQHGAYDFPLADLLPLFDDFDRTLDASMKTSNLAAMQEGLRLVQKKYRDLLARTDITPIIEVPALFDNALHEVLEDRRTYDDDSPPLVTEIVRSGYRCGGRTIRKALVVIGADQPPSPGEPVDPDHV